MFSSEQSILIETAAYIIVIDNGTYRLLDRKLICHLFVQFVVVLEIVELSVRLATHNRDGAQNNKRNSLLAQLLLESLLNSCLDVFPLPLTNTINSFGLFSLFT